MSGRPRKIIKYFLSDEESSDDEGHYSLRNRDESQWVTVFEEEDDSEVNIVESEKFTVKQNTPEVTGCKRKRASKIAVKKNKKSKKEIEKAIAENVNPKVINKQKRAFKNTVKKNKSKRESEKCVVENVCVVENDSTVTGKRKRVSKSTDQKNKKSKQSVYEWEKIDLPEIS